MDDGLIVYGCRLVIPAKMRHEILSKLHESHQGPGSVRTKQRARLTVYWPGIDNCIDSVILSCMPGASSLASEGTPSCEAPAC